MSYRRKFRLIPTLIGACVALVAPAMAQNAPQSPVQIKTFELQNDLQGADISALLADYEAYRLKFSPAEAARVQSRLPRTWPDLSPGARAVELAETEALLRRVTRLGPAHTLNTTILETILTSKVARLRLDPDRLPFTGDSGFHTEPSFVISRARIRNEMDADDLIARINAIPAYFETNIVNMRRGISTGYVAHTDPLATTLDQLSEMVVETPADSPLFVPFQQLPATLPTSTELRLRSEALAAVQSATAAYANLLRFMKHEYAGHARTKPGIGSLARSEEHTSHNPAGPDP